MLMIELNINAGSYDRVLDAPIERSTAGVDVPTSNDAMAADGPIEPEHNIFAMAQNIMKRSYYYRPMRRSSCII